jgi:hypothetical protein
MTNLDTYGTTKFSEEERRKRGRCVKFDYVGVNRNREA